MEKNKIKGSEQQTQHVTIGTQGNNDQVTQQGEMRPDQRNNRGDGSIPNQDRSSAANQDRSGSYEEQNI